MCSVHISVCSRSMELTRWVWWGNSDQWSLLEHTMYMYTVVCCLPTCYTWNWGSLNLLVLGPHVLVYYLTFDPRLGPLFMFEEHISSQTAGLIYKLGPSYFGSFQAPVIGGTSVSSLLVSRTNYVHLYWCMNTLNTDQNIDCILISQVSWLQRVKGIQTAS